MTPIRFKGHQKVLGAPAGWDEAKDGPCGGLPVAVQDGVCISHWRPSWRQRVSLLFGASVVLGVFSGNTQPPVSLAVEFEKTDYVGPL